MERTPLEDSSSELDEPYEDPMMHAEPNFGTQVSALQKPDHAVSRLKRNQER